LERRTEYTYVSNTFEQKKNYSVTKISVTVAVIPFCHWQLKWKKFGDFYRLLGFF